MAEGWICIHRSIQEHWLWKDKPFSFGQAWVDLLMLANYEDKKTYCKGKLVVCKRGDVNLSLTELSKRWLWDRKKVKKFIMLLESDNMVTSNITKQRTTITIVNYGFYQDIGTTKRTTEGTTITPTTPQRLPITNKENKDNNSLLDIVGYLNERTGKSFKATSAKTKSVINARLKEGFTVEDFRAVIDKKCDEWLGDPKMEQYLRPETLFGTKFEGYLQQKGSSNGRSKNDMGKTNGYNPGKAEGLPDCLSWM